MNIKDEVALVTGGGGGIGRAIAIGFARQGVAVVVSDINLEEAKKVANEIKDAGGKAITVKTDVTKGVEANKTVRTALDEFGRLDILVTSHGGSARERMSLFHESTEDVQDHVIDVNLKGVLNCCRAVLGHMIQKKKGKIVNIGSVAGMFGSSGQADYSAAKAGIITFTRALAKEVGHYGIRVNCVSPGLIKTPGAPKIGPRYDDLLKTVLLGRFGTPEEVANLVIFLASDEASYITGQNFAVCGGRSA